MGVGLTFLGKKADLCIQNARVMSKKADFFKKMRKNDPILCVYSYFFVLIGYFAQMLRYTAPADARSTIVRLRSAETASLAFEQNSTLKMRQIRC
jgi:hypothetical protein